MLVGVQLFVPGSNLPPVLKTVADSIRPRRSFHCQSTPPSAGIDRRGHWSCWWLSNCPCRDRKSRRYSRKSWSSHPPQTIIPPPVQTAVGKPRPDGAPVVLVAVQLSVAGLYLPPVFKATGPINPPQTIISLPVQTAVCSYRPVGRVGETGGCPTIHGWIVSPARVQIHADISSPDDHLAAGPHCRKSCRPSGALVVLVAVQLSVPGLYLPPVFRNAAAIKSTPDDHFTASPHCCVACSGIGRVGGAGGCPTVRAGIVPPAGVQIGRAAQCLRPRRSFHCQSTLLCGRLGPRARW